MVASVMFKSVENSESDRFGGERKISVGIWFCFEAFSAGLRMDAY